MSEPTKQNRPWLVAVWPGMGQVALTAGYYLMAKLKMHETDPLPAQDLFEVESVQVKEGLVRTTKLPENHVFLWKDPADRHDLVLLIGEAQPPAGKLAFCGRLLDYAERMGIKEVFTFAAMATDMHPRSDSRVVAVASLGESRERLRRAGIEIMSDGQITGLNGVLLGAAAQRRMHGIGFLGEMPAFAAQVPFPKASCAVLQAFTRMAGIEIDLRELEEYGRTMEDQLAEALEKLQEALQQRTSSAEEKEEEEAEAPIIPAPETEAEESGPRVTEADRARLERLFAQAAKDRSKAFELKRELDLLGVFREYEDRFLDIFRNQGTRRDAG